jgi:predicted negative regulator of RcsB-dependent stress response
MATYDLEQQEQLDQFKHFWKQYGNLITWLLVLALGGYAAWMFYQKHQGEQAQDAAGLYEALDVANQAGDLTKVQQAFKDLKDKYPRTTLAEQGALMAAKAQTDRQKPEEGRAALQWLVDNGNNPDLVAVGRLRLAGMQMDAKQYDEAIKTLSEKLPEEFEPLANDRRGDILLAQGKKDDAAKAYLAAWKALEANVEYRSLIDIKLTAMGLPPEAKASGKMPVNMLTPAMMMPAMPAASVPAPAK